jgi:hypothetical protein
MSMLYFPSMFERDMFDPQCVRFACTFSSDEYFRKAGALDESPLFND